MTMGYFINRADSLPYELVWQILIQVPAQDLSDTAMFVCKNWYKIINTHDFIYAHLRRSTPGYLVWNRDDCRNTYMRMSQDGEISLSKHSYNFPGFYFLSSCNGLILESAYGGDNENTPLIIKNPITKRFTLSPFFGPTVESPLQRSAIAYAPTSMEYKVIATSYVVGEDPEPEQFCAILTVGVDTSWRLFDTQHLPDKGMARDLLFWRPFVTEGFVHWTQFYGTCILTMNVETESITQIQIPRPEYNLPRGIMNYYFPVERSSSVSVLIALDDFKWEVWEMKPETGEWTKMSGIDLVARKSAINRCLYGFDVSVKSNDLFPDWKPFLAGWLKYPGVIFFVFGKPYYPNLSPPSGFVGVYNVRT